MPTLYWAFDATDDHRYNGNWTGRGATPGGGWSTIAPEAMGENDSLHRYHVAANAFLDGARADRFVITGPSLDEDRAIARVGHTLTLSSDLALSGEVLFDTIGPATLQGDNAATLRLQDETVIRGNGIGLTIEDLMIVSEYGLQLDEIRDLTSTEMSVDALSFTAGAEKSVSIHRSDITGTVLTDKHVSLNFFETTVSGDISVQNSATFEHSTIHGTLSLTQQTSNTGGANAAVLRNTALEAGVSGTAVRGNHADNSLEIGTGATVTGTILMGTGDDMIWFTGGHSDGTIYMGDGNDTVILSTQTIETSAHAGVLSLGTGNDIYRGNASDGQVDGGAGADIMFGGAGSDRLVYATSDAGVQIDLEHGIAQGGHATGDLFVDFEKVSGSHHADTLTGDAGTNLLNGLSGDDTLTGGAGRDVLVGGSGADVFVFNSGDAGTTNMSRDLIRDFDASEGDVIDLRGVGNHFSTSGFTGSGGEVIQHGIQVLIDIDGDAVADMRIDVLGDALDASSFWF